MTTVAIAKSAPARIAKGKLGVYFAWGAFSKRDGKAFVDAHGDKIPDEELVAGALSLAKSAKLGHEHDGTITGSVPLVMPMAEDIQAALELTSPHAGLVVGFTPTAEVAKSIDASIEAGEPWQMSIEGEAMAELVKATVAKSADVADVTKAEHRRTLRKLRIDKIDLVRAAAHGVGTSIAIAKRAESTSPAAPVAKAGMKCADCGAAMKADATACPECGPTKKPIAKRAPALTDPTNGHAHLIYDVELQDGSTSYEVMPGEESGFGHSHPFVRLADGSISIGEAAGHTHTVSTLGEAIMADDLNKSLLAAQADVTKARGMLATAIALPPEQLAFAKRLEGAALEAFLSRSEAERATVAAPIHKSERTGRVFFKGEEALVELAKDADATHAELAKARGETASAAIAKSAAAIPHVKGAALLAKAVHGVALTDAEKTEALADLAAVDASLSVVTKRVGSGAEPVEGDDNDPQVALEKATDAFAKANNLTPASAAIAFAKTEDGKRLYAAAYPVGRRN